jgi:hypothetical protein
MPIPKRYLINTEVNMGHRKIDAEFSNEYLEKKLENGHNLRKSKTYPIKCQLKLNRFWRMSEAQCETIRRNTGSLPIYPYQQHWHPHFAIIPTDGITRRGYVKEVWVEACIKPIEVDNQHYDLIDPYVHDIEQWIQGFMLDSSDSIQLLPSPKLMVKYYRHSRENNF